MKTTLHTEYAKWIRKPFDFAPSISRAHGTDQTKAFGITEPLSRQSTAMPHVPEVKQRTSVPTISWHLRWHDKFRSYCGIVMIGYHSWHPLSLRICQVSMTIMDHENWAPQDPTRHRGKDFKLFQEPTSLQRKRGEKHLAVSDRWVGFGSLTWPWLDVAHNKNHFWLTCCRILTQCTPT